VWVGTVLQRCLTIEPPELALKLETPSEIAQVSICAVRRINAWLLQLLLPVQLVLPGGHWASRSGISVFNQQPTEHGVVLETLSGFAQVNVNGVLHCLVSWCGWAFTCSAASPFTRQSPHSSWKR
jgi:hypothetical protein